MCILHIRPGVSVQFRVDNFGYSVYKSTRTISGGQSWLHNFVQGLHNFVQTIMYKIHEPLFLSSTVQGSCGLLPDTSPYPLKPTSVLCTPTVFVLPRIYSNNQASRIARSLARARTCTHNSSITSALTDLKPNCSRNSASSISHSYALRTKSPQDRREGGRAPRSHPTTPNHTCSHPSAQTRCTNPT